MIRCTVRVRGLLTSALLLSFGLALDASGVEAQGPRSPYQFIEGRHEAGIFAGQLMERRGIMELGPGGGIMAGARYALDVGGGPFALEASGFVASSDRRVRAPNLEGTAIEELGVSDALVFGLDGRVRFTLTGPRTWNGFAPFVLAGGGIVSSVSSRIEAETELPTDLRSSFGPSFLGTLGGGTRFFLTEQLVLRLDATANFWKVGTPRGFLNLPEQESPVVQQEWPAVGSLMLGLSWRF